MWRAGPSWTRPFPHEFSGEKHQRVGIVRAFVVGRERYRRPRLVWVGLAVASDCLIRNFCLEDKRAEASDSVKELRDLGYDTEEVVRSRPPVRIHPAPPSSLRFDAFSGEMRKLRTCRGDAHGGGFEPS